MIHVRFPDGQVVTYNNANRLESYPDDQCHRLYHKHDDKKDWICSVQYSAGATFEAVRPCAVDNPIVGITLEKSLQYVMDHIKELPSYKLKDLKRLLQKFSTRSHTWNE